jgi:RNA polymerase sigma-70 factor (ECF subfamily)
LDPRSTQDLLRRFRDGETDVVGLLLDRYYDRVCAVVHRLLPAAMRPRYDTGDVVQEAMIRVFRSLDAFEYRNEGAFFSWVCTATERVLIDLIRHATRQRRDGGPELSLDATNAPQPAAPTQDPGEKAVEHDEVCRVMAGLDRLPEAQRRVILYREYGRLSWKELGEALGVSHVTARRRYLKAVASLGRILAE